MSRKSDLTKLASDVHARFHAMILDQLANVTRDQVWITVARYLFNKQELCDDACDDGVHFHDTHDWSDRDERKILEGFYQRLSTRNKADMYINDIVRFIETKQMELKELFDEQEPASLELFASVTDEESREYLQFLLDADIEESFQCSLICTLMEMQAKEGETLRETQWFPIFFRYFLDDFDDDDDETSEEGTSEDDGTDEE